jgi:hypothetical protein
MSVTSHLSLNPTTCPPTLASRRAPPLDRGTQIGSAVENSVPIFLLLKTMTWPVIREASGLGRGPLL